MRLYKIMHKKDSSVEYAASKDDLSKQLGVSKFTIRNIIKKCNADEIYVGNAFIVMNVEVDSRTLKEMP